MFSYSSGLFSINEQTGAIVVEKALDRETNETLRMHVLAEDAGDPKRFDQSEVIFELTDVNDNAPVIWPRKSVASVFEVQCLVQLILKRKLY